MRYIQFFEGTALGLRIAELRKVRTWRKKILLGLLYPITTPVGTTVGVIFRTTYDGNTYNWLIARGGLDSLAAGILMYATYVELVAAEIHQNKSFRKQSRRDQILSFLMLYIGAALMSILALWI